MIVIPLRFFDIPNAVFLEVLAWFTQASHLAGSVFFSCRSFGMWIL